LELKNEDGWMVAVGEGFYQLRKGTTFWIAHGIF